MYNLPSVPKALTQDEVDRRIILWHDVEEPEWYLHEYLGWTWEEFERWIVKGILPRG